MPGRDELLQQNIARAQSKAASPQPQETVGRGPIGGVGGPRSFLGGNYDVYSALESIEFQGALGDASMRGNIAYIRVWKRGGTAAQTNSGAITQDPGDADALTALDSALVSEWGKFFPKTNTDTSVIFNGDPSILPLDPSLSYAVDGANFNRDEDGNIISGFIETTFSPTPNPQRQQALGTQTPTTSGVQITSTQIVSPVAFEAQVRPQQNLNNGTGQVRSANPNGFTNALLNFGQSFIGGGFGKVSYSGQANAPRGGAVAVPTSGDMMWQFLFNPSELQLEAGPEFKGAEVWGVSDKANSGQPLHWSHNKNASLKFNSVLLNGFVFGRKVEALEQGLLELFMSREGEGQHGPHVLEFVWGKRSFGPCVIKNIDIKEKMWDEGEVVNAELSFTLEQVPEWTINDGAYVDVARPGRRPLANDPTLETNASTAPAAAPAPASGDDKTKTGKGEGKDQKSQKPNTPPRSLQSLKCQNAFDYTANLKDLQNRVRGTKAGGANQVLEIQASEFFTIMKGINSSAKLDFDDSTGQALSTTSNVASFESGWKKIKEGDPFGLKRKSWLETRTQQIVNRTGAGWNNKSVCPNTAR